MSLDEACGICKEQGWGLTECDFAPCLLRLCPHCATLHERDHVVRKAAAASLATLEKHVEAINESANHFGCGSLLMREQDLLRDLGL